MHTLEMTHSVTSAMSIVQLFLPKSSSSQHINIASMNVRVFGPDESLNVKITKQHSSICILLLVSRLAKVECSCHVGGAIEVLSS
jgi:hypothetical protein